MVVKWGLEGSCNDGTRVFCNNANRYRITGENNITLTLVYFNILQPLQYSLYTFSKSSIFTYKIFHFFILRLQNINKFIKFSLKSIFCNMEHSFSFFGQLHEVSSIHYWGVRTCNSTGDGRHCAVVSCFFYCRILPSFSSHGDYNTTN